MIWDYLIELIVTPLLRKKIEDFVFIADKFDEIIDPFDEYSKKDFERDYDEIHSLGFSLLPNTKYWLDKHPDCDD